MTPKQSLLVILLTSSLLGACHSANQPNANNEPVVTEEPETTAATELCASDSCGSKTILATIPDAENILFTETGKLFVSGGTNVFEITSDGGNGFQATPLFAGSCNFSGLAQRGNVLYAACFDGRLYAGRIGDSTLINPIHDLTGMNAPNGMAVDSAGLLYIINGPVSGSGGLPDPKIVRVTFDANNPFMVTEQIEWLNSGLEFPNGLVFEASDDPSIDAGQLYLTDSATVPASLGLLRRVTIGSDGNPQNLITLRNFNGILDDLSLVPGGILVSGFSNGQIHLTDRQGNLLQETASGVFSSASSVQQGTGPLFSDTDILVTEKGTIGDTSSNNGNVLSVFRPN